MMRAVLIATSLAVAMPCFAQQVRVINGDFEHVYVRAASHASITRSIAGCFRFLILIQCFDRPA